jgi:radical SAM protein with 4Fe4S-binding SPASM domain
MFLVDASGNIFTCCMPPIFENTELSKFGNIENTDIIKALERRQNFINNFRNNPPQFCKKCYLYIRR